MAKQCVHYRLLNDRLLELSEKFVNDQVVNENNDPAGFKPDIDRLAAYRLLIHAEIEDFLEQKAKENLDLIGSRISAAGPWVRQFPELLSVAMVLKKWPPLSNQLDSHIFSKFIGELVCTGRTAIKDNNGVKTASFMLLSILSGKTIEEIDSVLGAGLNSYGKQRGDVAHKSVTRTNSLLAPSAELNAAKDLVTEIGTYFDVCV